MHRLIRFTLITLLCVPAFSMAGADDRDPLEFDFGPLISRQRDLHGHMRLRVLGPFFERATHDDGQTLTAVRPLYSRYDDPEMERRRSEYLWPVGYTKQFRDEHSGRVLLAFWTRFDVEDPDSRYRFWLFPLYFQGRDKHGEEYAALFPLGGRIHEFLGRDEIEFILFPLYLRTELNEVPSHSFLWPIISHTQGRGIYRFRVFPFYGQNRHRDRYNKKFVMWPFWTSAEYYYEGSSGSGYILFPVYGRLTLEDQRSWMVLPPFFRVSRGERVNMVLAPWPIFQRRTGEIRQTYIWPLWGTKTMRGTHSRFFLWPFLQEERIDRGDTVARRFYLLPFYYSDTHRERAPAAPDPQEPVPRGTMVSNYQKIWPLLSYIRDGDEVRFRMLALWPLKYTPSIERNYAPFWSLIQHARYEEASDTEILWGLYRRQRRGEDKSYTSLFPLFDRTRDDRHDEAVRRWSFLKGLIGYERRGTNRRYQLLYLLRWGQLEETEP